MLPSAGQRRAPMHSNQQKSAVPNLFWRAHHTDALRRDERFVALMPEDEVELVGISSLRYVRQGSEAWRRAHQGRITTGGLLGALGWRHEKAAGRIRLPKNMRGNEHLQAAYTQLLAGLDDPTSPGDAAAAAGGDAPAASSSGGGGGGGGGGSAAAAAAARNEQRRAEYNEGLRGSPPPAVSASARRAICEQAALGGTLSVRLAWGKTQEAAALYSLAALFPSSVIEEVGLFAPEPSALPRAAPIDASAAAGGGGGGDGGDGDRGTGGGGAAKGAAAVPPLGASPDGMICQELSFSGAEVLEAAAALRAAGGCGAAQRDAARALLRLGLSRVACAAPAGGAPPPTAAPGGGCGGSGASPCGALDARTAEEVIAEFVERTAAALAARGSGGAPAGGGGAGEQGGGDGGLAHSVWVREVVEVKSHCPFLFKGRRRGKKGRVSVDFCMAPCTPAARLQPAWVPQLQMHLLCSGCATALLVSRTPHNGLRVFRVWRDDAYLASLLAVLSVLLSRHAARGVAPAGGAFASMPCQAPLLARTCELARGAEIVAEPGCGVGVGDDGGAALAPPACGDGSNVSAFWV
ncbi:MAG: hypothetical protein J3K34DRAFT_521030 [Monoraphidium minutum]|nr:MAG: hypothetical protein J3K34DRAFT_521030 [Monoraphidium minutum]